MPIARFARSVSVSIDGSRPAIQASAASRASSAVAPVAIRSQGSSRPVRLIAACVAPGCHRRM